MKEKKKILAVASGGGHWVQLLRLSPAFGGHEVRYVSTHEGFKKDVSERFHTVVDANMWQKARLLVMFIQVLAVLIRYRPDVVISTGAAPGFAAVFFGRLFGARTVWVDSIANSEELSGSGKQVGRFAHVWLTQWPHLAKPDGPSFWGSVL